MKALLVALIALAPLAALAAPTQTLTCDAHALEAGGTGKTGTVVISVTKTNDDANDRRVNLSVGWNDSDGAIIAPGKFCGWDMPSNMDCSSIVLHPGNLSYIIDSHCGLRMRRGSVYYYQHGARVLLDEARGHGRITCENTKAIELSNCR